MNDNEKIRESYLKESTNTIVIGPCFQRNRAKSSDLKPLDFYFWGAAESKVHEEKPKTVEDLKEVVETFSRSIQKETLWKVADNFMKRVQFCFDENGGHFEHLLKKSKL